MNEMSKRKMNNHACDPLGSIKSLGCRKVTERIHVAQQRKSKYKFSKIDCIILSLAAL
jgi:hypothetical protein